MKSYVVIAQWPDQRYCRLLGRINHIWNNLKKSKDGYSDIGLRKTDNNENYEKTKTMSENLRNKKDRLRFYGHFSRTDNNGLKKIFDK